MTYADEAFLQMFLWERFEILSPKSVKFEAVELEIVAILRGKKSENRQIQASGLDGRDSNKK